MDKRVGQRVSRQVYMDDGTWRRKGDSCLKTSPRRYGTVRHINEKVPETLYVEWDDGTTGTYFHFGVDPEPETSGRLI